MSPALPVSQASENARSSAHLSVASTSSVPDDDLWPAPSQPHLTTRPHALIRKSASVDSLINIVQRASFLLDAGSNGQLQTGASVSTEPGSPCPEAQTLSTPPSTMSLSDLLRSKVSRRRGATTDNGASTQDESDFDKSSATSTTAKVKGRVRARLLSLKSMASGSGSEARDTPPPTTLFTRGSSASLGNLKTSNLPSSKLSPKSSTLHNYKEADSKETKRARSQSVGATSRSTASRLAKRLSVGYQSPRPEIVHEVTIAVVGSPGCGKSTFIRKSLKRYDLSSSESFMTTITAGDMTRNITYTCRRAHLFNEFNTVTRLLVYEYDSQDWKIDGSSSLISIWPSGLPHIDGIFVCYDESDSVSFSHVVQLVSGYKILGIPNLVLACKSDLEQCIHPEDAARVVDPYSKIVEVSQNTEIGKSRMRKAVDVLLRRIDAVRSEQHRKAPIDSSVTSEKTKTPALTVQTGAPLSPINLASPTSPHLLSSPRPPLPRTPLYPAIPASPISTKNSPPSKGSPTRVRSMNDILAEHQKLLVSSPYKSDEERINLKNISSLSTAKSAESLTSVLASVKAIPASSLLPTTNEPSGRNTNSGNGREVQKSRTPPTPWATLDELLEKLFFLAISDDDPSYIAHFFLTYRRFATPRSVLLGMQKRMNELRQPTGDITLACFAQMRICNLLEQWMKDYPSDFVVPGTHGALNAFIRHILSHSHTLSYGSDFIPFLETLPRLHDSDSAWALKADDFCTVESDNETDSLFGTEHGSAVIDKESPTSSLSPHPRASASEPTSSPRAAARERRSSLPLNAMALIRTPILSSALYQRTEEPSAPSAREIVTRLQKVAAMLAHQEADAIANEITRRELELFLKIERRDWLRHTLIPGKKDPNTDPIAKFNFHYNDLHEWAVSLILCHDKPKGRARQIEKFAEVASKLRTLNNYSGLRALITAINQATYPGDQPMKIFRTKVDLHKKFLSSDILLRTTGSHQSYRMALKNTRGPCIPSLEVHTSDLRRANEGNPDMKPDDPSKINWAKYNMIGRFVATTTALQQRCCGPNGYKFVENKRIEQLFDVPIMDYEMQQSRVS